MNSSPDPTPEQLPDLPWAMAGFMRVGLFSTTGAAALRAGLSGLPSNRLLILAVRYLEGDVRYDGLMIAQPARHRLRVGAYIHEFWTSNPVLHRDAKRLWGVDPYLAEFEWTDDRVDVLDSRGHHLSMASTPGSGRSVTMPLPLPCFTDYRDRLSYAVPRYRAVLRPARATIERWPEHLPALRRPASRLGIDFPRFTIRVGPPRPL